MWNLPVFVFFTFISKKNWPIFSRQFFVRVLVVVLSCRVVSCRVVSCRVVSCLVFDVSQTWLVKRQDKKRQANTKARHQKDKKKIFAKTTLRFV
jgi:hypothetical protein